MLVPLKYDYQTDRGTNRQTLSPKLCIVIPVSHSANVYIINIILSIQQHNTFVQNHGTKNLKNHFGITWHYLLKTSSNIYTGGHLIIGRTQLSDVASFRALQTRICEIWIQCRQLHEKLKPRRKNCQITTNIKHFTVANVHPPFPPTICTHGGSEELQNLKLFF